MVDNRHAKVRARRLHILDLVRLREREDWPGAFDPGALDRLMNIETDM